MPSYKGHISKNTLSKMINRIYGLRSNFIIIGLTGRTGSGCTTVAKILSTREDKLSELKSRHSDFREAKIDNQARKDRIVFNFIKNNWAPFTRISASDVIYYFALKEDFTTFKDAIKSSAKIKNEILDKNNEAYRDNEKVTHATESLSELQAEYNSNHEKVIQFEKSLNKEEIDDKGIENIKDFLLSKLPEFREKIEKIIFSIDRDIVYNYLQDWGNNIRKYGSIAEKDNLDEKSPSIIARKINQFIKVFRRVDKNNHRPTHIVIDALRNPFEILYFRERYSGFYCMSINTTEEIRRDKLLKNKGLRIHEINRIDYEEKDKHELVMSFQNIDIDKCIELSDIFVSHDEKEYKNNEDLITQIFTYVALILHPGLITPTPQERLMQIAYTAKLNSGCLSRQVGAAVTDSKFSVKAIGWNSTPEGQVPCNLRQLDDLIKKEDKSAFSNYELNDIDFKNHISVLKNAYDEVARKNLNGLYLTYCFKNIHTKIKANQRYNQVHTRSLHAEENAFLQLAKYGSQGIEGGKLFTTASCCELCAKKAYHLGIRQIYYIDSYPGISKQHIFESGEENHRPEIILFSGAVGRAYVNLYNPFVPLKDELQERTHVDVSNPQKDIKDQKK